MTSATRSSVKVNPRSEASCDTPVSRHGPFTQDRDVARNFLVGRRACLIAVFTVSAPNFEFKAAPPRGNKVHSYTHIHVSARIANITNTRQGHSASASTLDEKGRSQSSALRKLTRVRKCLSTKLVVHHEAPRAGEAHLTSTRARTEETPLVCFQFFQRVVYIANCSKHFGVYAHLVGESNETVHVFGQARTTIG